MHERMLNHTDALLGYFAEQEFHAAALRVIERGYRALRLDPFGSGFYELDRDQKLQAVALVEAVRDAIGPDGKLSPLTNEKFSGII